MAMSSIPPSTFLLAIPLLFVLNVLSEIFLSPIRHIRGPILARFTNIYRACIAYTGRSCNHYRTWHRRYGTAVRVGPNAISISDTTLIRTIYGTKNAWIKSDMYRPNDVLFNGHRISNIFNTPSKSFHATYASPIGTFWTNTKVLNLEPLIDDTQSLFVSQLETRYSDSGTCMMDEWMGYLAWDLASNVAFGQHHGFLEAGEDVKGIIAGSQAGVEYFAAISQIPWLDEWLGKNPIIRLGPKSLIEAFAIAGRFYEGYVKDLSDGVVKKGCLPHLMDKYYGLRDTHKVATDDQILQWLMINVNAGGDSMAGVMRSVVYLVVKHQRTHERLRKELDSAVTSCPASYQETKDLPYLNAVLLECQRFVAPLGLMLERVVPSSGFTLPDGRFIPAGVKVGINPAVVTRDPEIFGEDADAFRPERWLRRVTGYDERMEEKEEEEVFEKRYRRMYDVTDFVFGAGSRVCMGKHLVRVAMLKTFATLFTCFDVRFPDPEHVWKYNITWFLYQSDIPMVISQRQKT